MYLSIIISGLLGLGLGFVASKILFVGQWYSLIIWGVVGLIVGLFGRTRKFVIISGAVYGALLAISFMFSGYNGATPLLQNTGLIRFTLILATIGAGCGIAASLIGQQLRKLYSK